MTDKPFITEQFEALKTWIGAFTAYQDAPTFSNAKWLSHTEQRVRELLVEEGGL